MDHCLSLPFDQYQRYKIVSDIINKFRAEHQRFRILEVGAGFEEILKKFLPSDDIYCLDKEFPSDYSQKENHIPGDILISKIHERFDFVIAIDVYEHIPEIDRKKFIDITIPLSTIATIIAAPFDQDEVSKCEFFANEVFKSSHNSDYIWLREHIENGLPSLSQTLDLVNTHHLNSIIIPNGYLPRWFDMITTFLLTEGKPEFQPMMTILYELYNRNFYQYDNRNPAYRHVIVILQEDRKIDFSDLIAKKVELSELVEKTSILNSFIEKIERSYQISDITYKHEIETKNRQLVERNAQIATQIKDLEHATATKDSQLEQMSTQIHGLEHTLTTKDSQLEQMSAHIQGLEHTLTTKDSQLELFEQTIQGKDTEIIFLNSRLSQLKVENDSLKSSISYRLLSRFQKRIIERLLPQNTPQRNYYNLGIKGGRILINEGWDSFWYKFNERNAHNRYTRKNLISKPDIKFLIQPENVIDTLDLSVSIIIPTKNPGPDFLSVLEKIKNQKGIASVEIIIVDSGSTDGTCEVAETFGCKIFKIKTEEFNHGLTRNYGAEQASGEFIVFLVQDAIPIGDYWLYKMATLLLKDEKIAAVTCRQVPRSDADLFAGFILWSHNKSLNRTQDRVYSSDINLDDFGPLDKRISAGIEDTCCMIQNKIFNQFKFGDIQYGEDLDLGLRLLKSGKKTAFLYSTGVIHSHNRDSHYFFKRSFVDTLMLDSLLNLPNKPADNNIPINNLIGQIFGLYTHIHEAIAGPINTYSSATQAVEYMKMVLQSPAFRDEGNLYSSDIGHFTNIDSPNTLKILLSYCVVVMHANSFKEGETLIANYCAVLDSFSEYCSVYSSLEGKELELSESFEKLFALVAGSTLATHFCNKTQTQLSESESTLMTKLMEGI